MLVSMFSCHVHLIHSDLTYLPESYYIWTASQYV